MQIEHKCKYCGKICKNKNSLTQHEIRCKSNPDKINIVSNFIKYNEQLKNGEKVKSHSNQYIKVKQLGLPQPHLSDESIEKCKYWQGKKLSNEMKANISAGMKLAVKNNPQSYSSSNVNGRVKKVNYNGVILDGTWEQVVAKYLDDNNIKWIRPYTGIEYQYNGSTHLYFPDFYLVEYDYYIEVKGYERDKDRIKYSVVNNLILIKKDEIIKIKSDSYNIFNYIIV